MQTIKKIKKGSNIDISTADNNTMGIIIPHNLPQADAASTALNLIEE